MLQQGCENVTSCDRRKGSFDHSTPDRLYTKQALINDLETVKKFRRDTSWCTHKYKGLNKYIL